MSETIGEKIDGAVGKPLQTVKASLKALRATFFTKAEKTDNPTKRSKEKLPGGIWGKLLDKVTIFITTFQEEMNGVTAEENKNTEEAEKAVKMGVGETMSEINTALSLDEKTNNDDLETALALGLKNLKGPQRLNEDKRTAAHGALLKINNAREGKSTDKLSVNELSSALAVGVWTLHDLKQKYPSAGALTKALNAMRNSLEKSKFDFIDLFGREVRSLFAVDKPEKILEKFGIKIGTMDYLGGVMSAVGVSSGPKGEALEAKEVLGSLKKSMSEKQIEKAAAFFKKYFFPNSDCVKVVSKINQLATGNKSVGLIADLAFSIQDNDLEFFAKKLLA